MLRQGVGLYLSLFWPTVGVYDAENATCSDAHWNVAKGCAGSRACRRQFVPALRWTDLLSAACTSMAASRQSLFLKYNVSENPMLQEISRNPIAIDDQGMILVPQDLRQGIEVDEKAVEKFRASDL